MTRVPLERKVLNENDRLAADLRQGFLQHGTRCVNLISSPGSGKTMLLERTLASFERGRRVAVLTGDIQTDNDAQRLARYGFPVRQITTGGACHLDARMVVNALAEWQPDAIDLLLIENVGNLVCPSSYDLGEEARVVVLSVTEGEDKPLKYPATPSRRPGGAQQGRLAALCAVPHGSGARIHPARAARCRDSGSLLHHRRRTGCLAQVGGHVMLTEHPLLNAVIFASLGIAVFALAAAILLKATPLQLWRELVQERNVAVAIFAGAAAIGICMIIAAAMH